ncbi:hypothetical protein ABD91_20970 [Lysinibacillus sphaericus]|uniref:hypothetical protein n=1 Tax=Lysinibacillus sphaericus TaxID=1421 RepID=UPI0018CE2E58|nr:hypothetical protein [Lysinibacillus sphaericus]MBG9693215.1 hypothetical protein [Lysinibacillus sphaericus]
MKRRNIEELFAEFAPANKKSIQVKLAAIKQRPTEIINNITAQSFYQGGIYHLNIAIREDGEYRFSLISMNGENLMNGPLKPIYNSMIKENFVVLSEEPGDAYPTVLEFTAEQAKVDFMDVCATLKDKGINCLSIENSTQVFVEATIQQMQDIFELLVRSGIDGFCEPCVNVDLAELGYFIIH